MRRWIMLGIGLVLAMTTSTEAAIRRYPLRAPQGVGYPGRDTQFILADTSSELPTTDVGEGDTAYSKDDDKFWKRTASAWVEVGGGGGVSDGDKGDITVSGGGGTWTIDSDAIAEADIPAAIARDSEVTSAVSAHEAASDPHTGYQRESEKGAASGYASLDGSTTVPDAQIPSAIARDSEVTSAVSSAISTHEGLSDPHTGYQKESTLEADVEAVADLPDLGGALPLAKLADDASSGLCLVSGGAGGDPNYATCPGGGGGLSHAQVMSRASLSF